MLRNPGAVRPWQHVLEPLSGYLQLGAGLFQGKESYRGSWNFGPAGSDTLTVGRVAELMTRGWEKMRFECVKEKNAPHEAALLRLDCTKAENVLHWHGVWDSETAVGRTVRWYREFYENQLLCTPDDLDSYCAEAEKRGLSWTK